MKVKQKRSGTFLAKISKVLKYKKKAKELKLMIPLSFITAMQPIIFNFDIYSTYFVQRLVIL